MRRTGAPRIRSGKSRQQSSQPAADWWDQDGKPHQLPSTLPVLPPMVFYPSLGRGWLMANLERERADRGGMPAYTPPTLRENAHLSSIKFPVEALFEEEVESPLFDSFGGPNRRIPPTEKIVPTAPEECSPHLGSKRV